MRKYLVIANHGWNSFQTKRALLLFLDFHSLLNPKQEVAGIFRGWHGLLTQLVPAETETYQEVVGPDLSSRVQRCLPELDDVLVAKIIPVLRPRLVWKGTVTRRHGPQSVDSSLNAPDYDPHMTHTHPVPGFIIRPPLHIVIVVLHLDEPLSQDGRRVVYVVICRHPVEGRGMATTEKQEKDGRTSETGKKRKKKHN